MQNTKPQNTNKAESMQLGSVLLISITHMLHDIYSSFLAPMLPLLIDKLGISYSAAGFLTVIQRLPSLANPLVGILADKMSVRYFLIAAPMLTTVSMSLLGLAPSYTILAVLLLVMGVSSTLFHVPAPVFVRNVSGNKIGRGMSFYMLGGELARTLGPLTILAAISWWGLGGTWRLIPFGMLASFLLFLRFHRHPMDQKPKTVQFAKIPFKQWLPFFAIIAAIVFFRSVMKNAFTTFLPTYMTAQGADAWTGGKALALLQFFGAIGTFLAGSISDRIGRTTTLLIIAIVSPGLMWLFVQSSGFLSYVALSLLGFFMFANTPVLLAMVQDVGHQNPATLNGIYMTINFGISSLVSVLIGVIGDIWSLDFSFQVSAVVAVGGVPAVLMMRRWYVRNQTREKRTSPSRTRGARIIPPWGKR